MKASLVVVRTLVLEVGRRPVGRGARPAQRGAAPDLVHERLVVVDRAGARLVRVEGRVLLLLVVHVLVLLLLHGQFRVQLVHEARLGEQSRHAPLSVLRHLFETHAIIPVPRTTVQSNNQNFIF